MEINIFTLNCWGLGLGISKNRNERMIDIGIYLSEQNYDIVLLQEVWKKENYRAISNLTATALPYSHYYDNGIIGTGTCILSKFKIKDVTFHEFALNGYPHKIAHGDWFGGKGLGVAQLDIQGYLVHVFMSHYHATYNYNPLHDSYLGHRVVHSVESAQWIKLSSTCSDLTLYCGDFNTEPKDIPYQIVRYVTPLTDAWAEANGEEGGETSETPSNTYTTKSALKECPTGKRIDYIMYRAGPNNKAETISCTLPLPDKIPGKEFSYSDHEGVTAKILLSRLDCSETKSNREYVRMQSNVNTGIRKDVVMKAISILEEALRSVRYNRIMYLLGAVLCFVGLLVTFVFEQDHLGWDVLFFLIRMVLVIVGSFLFLMSVLFFRRERHSINSTICSLNLINDCDFDDFTERVNMMASNIDSREPVQRASQSADNAVDNVTGGLGEDQDHQQLYQNYQAQTDSTSGGTSPDSDTPQPQQHTVVTSHI